MLHGHNQVVPIKWYPIHLPMCETLFARQPLQLTTAFPPVIPHVTSPNVPSPCRQVQFKREGCLSFVFFPCCFHRACLSTCPTPSFAGWLRDWHFFSDPQYSFNGRAHQGTSFVQSDPKRASAQQTVRGNHHFVIFILCSQKQSDVGVRCNETPGQQEHPV